jgi:hypothetical protein
MDLKFFPVPGDCPGGFGYQPRIAVDYNYAFGMRTGTSSATSSTPTPRGGDFLAYAALTRGKERGNVYLRLLRDQ